MKKRPAGRFWKKRRAAPYLLSDEEAPLSELPDVAESPEVVSDDFFDLASFFLLFLAFFVSSVSSAADAPLLAGPPEPVIPLLPVASCDGITVGEDDVSAPLAPDDDPDAPLLPEVVSGDALPALLAGPPEPVMPLLPVAFCEGMTVGEEDVLPEAASVPVVCASATEDTDATITNDNERSVVFNAICSSLHEVESIVDAGAWRGTHAGAFSRHGRRHCKNGYKPLILFTFSQCKNV